MLRSEQQLLVGREWTATGRVMVRRRIVSRTISVDVTVRREELVFEREALPPGPGMPSVEPAAPLVIALREEVPVVELVTKPYELVTVSVVQVAGEQKIHASLASEHVSLQTSDGKRP